MVRYYRLGLCFLFISCIPYYFDEYGILVPKYPKYSLKDKKEFVIPDNLDTFNVYKNYGYYDIDGNLVKEDEETCFFYDKFCEKCRCYFFCVEKNKGKLEDKDLNPIYANKGYYFYDTKKM